MIDIATSKSGQERRCEACSRDIEILKHLMDGDRDGRRKGWDREKVLHEAGLTEMKIIFVRIEGIK